jgi:hypothetical protein
MPEPARRTGSEQRESLVQRLSNQRWMQLLVLWAALVSLGLIGLLILALVFQWSLIVVGGPIIWQTASSIVYAVLIAAIPLRKRYRGLVKRGQFWPWIITRREGRKFWVIARRSGRRWKWVLADRWVNREWLSKAVMVARAAVPVGLLSGLVGQGVATLAVALLSDDAATRTLVYTVVVGSIVTIEQLITTNAVSPEAVDEGCEREKE